jgi:hypothetical protein
MTLRIGLHHFFWKCLKNVGQDSVSGILQIFEETPAIRNSDKKSATDQKQWEISKNDLSRFDSQFSLESKNEIKLGRYYCDQKILDTNVIVLSYILKRPLCINNLNFDCVNFENVNVRFTEKIFKKL